MIELFAKTKEVFFGPADTVFSNGIRMHPNIYSENPSLLLINNSKVIFDLKSFAPQNTVIKYLPKQEWSANTKSLSLNTPPQLYMGKINGVSSIFDFLHECGHLQNESLTNDAESAKMYYAEHYFFKTSTINDPNRLKALKLRNDIFLQSEREAWAFSLHKVRNLEKILNIDIVNKMGGIKSISNYINRCLKSYADTTASELTHLGYIAYTEKQVKQILEKVN